MADNADSTAAPATGVGLAAADVDGTAPVVDSVPARAVSGTLATAPPPAVARETPRRKSASSVESIYSLPLNPRHSVRSMSEANVGDVISSDLFKSILKGPTPTGSPTTPRSTTRTYVQFDDATGLGKKADAPPVTPTRTLSHRTTRSISGTEFPFPDECDDRHQPDEASMSALAEVAFPAVDGQQVAMVRCLMSVHTSCMG